MVRRRGDQCHPGRAFSQPSDQFGYLMSRQLAAFARFSALRHLDLDLFRAGEISRGHAKAASSDLLDRAVWPISIFAPMKTLWVFASFTRVGFSANLIHRDGEALVCFRTQCAKRHSSGGK